MLQGCRACCLPFDGPTGLPHHRCTLSQVLLSKASNPLCLDDELLAPLTVVVLLQGWPQPALVKQSDHD